MARMHYGQTFALPTLNTRKDGRQTERVSFNCQVTYTGEIPTQPHAGEGLTKDISVSGLKIVSNHPVTRGTLLTLNVVLPDGHPPLTISSALVIWVSGVHFSVRFMHLSQETRRRLQSFIWRNIRKDAVDNQRTRFRIT
jgi:c-di-GMP-binding flagellar brake protein YcgR